MNVNLLRRISDFICKNPEKFDARAWGHCGTPMCIAGWAVALSGEGPYTNSSVIKERAKELLGLTAMEAARLFYPCYWPVEFAMKMDWDKAPSERAFAAAERIEHLINTGE